MESLIKPANEKIVGKVENEVITRTIKVDDVTSELSVKLAFDNSKGTFSVSTKITTKHVSLVNEEITEATIEQTAAMILQGVQHLIEKKKRWNDKQEKGDPNQLKIGEAAASE